MKALLEFDSREDLMYALKGPDAHRAIGNMFEELRKVWKYDAPEKTADEWREVLVNICEQFNVNTHGDY